MAKKGVWRERYPALGVRRTSLSGSIASWALPPSSAEIGAEGYDALTTL
jgi:hypothetical protein